MDIICLIRHRRANATTQTSCAVMCRAVLLCVLCAVCWAINTQHSVTLENPHIVSIGVFNTATLVPLHGFLVRSLHP